ncbi:hypothetical protein ACFLSY_06820 [Bacteroidota bacterium]
MKNIRKYCNFNNGYFRINREERNLAAIFYHTLLIGSNLKKFLEAINCDFPIVEKEMGIYFEYAFLRDLWSNISKDEKKIEDKLKKTLILDFLNPSNRQELESMEPYDFNRYFGAVRTLSSDYIASPGNWSIKYYDKNIINNKEFLKVCEFKWCFNAKPDIVIHTTHETAVCIEAKYESEEGKYPSNNYEKEIFKKRGIPYVGQLEIQKKIMKELLGIDTKFIFLVQKKVHKTYDNILTLTWTEAFDCLDTDNCPYYIAEWIDRLKKNN